jgi:hypothetical protein
MPDNIWVELTADEREQVLDALRLMQSSRPSSSIGVESLVAKITSVTSHPMITVGVYGGQVQWVLGNPFPIRVCDYDGEKGELPDIDDRGQRCRMWSEPGIATS